MKNLVLIPARRASTRLPDKMLADIGGQALIQRTFLRLQSANVADKVVVATDDEAIAEAVEAVGGQYVMTSIQHDSGTMRCAEALQILLQRGEQYDYIINVQGDEPFLDTRIVSQLFQNLAASPNLHIATVMEGIQWLHQVDNPNIVKLVSAQAQTGETLRRALYFSRAAIPFLRDAPAKVLPKGLYHRHIGVYGFSRMGLELVAKSPFSALENAEKLEQLRWLEAGLAIGVLLAPEAETGQISLSIDTEEDLQQARQYYAANKQI
jgi:3-deoxy-manno-octulosonate cytidylyltransferase (CMP-KDO synthetase)